MKSKSVLGTLRFIFFTVILFVLTFSAVVVTILNIYVPTYRAKINGKIIGYYDTEAQFDEVYAAIVQEKSTDGVEVKTYLEANPVFEVSYVIRDTIDKQNLYTNLREKVKAEYTVYNVIVKDKKEVEFATKASADEYANNLKKEIKGLKVEVTSEKQSELNEVTEVAKAKEIYNGLVSRYKPAAKVYTNNTAVYAKPTQISYSTNTSVSGGVKPASGIYTQFYGGGHGGIDIASRGNVPIYAYKAGVVTYRKWAGANSYGNLIKIDHGDGVVTYYAHLSGWNVVEGETVAAGQKIGDMGNTGRSTGQHLHFEIRVNGQTINPYPYIR